jgi:Septin
LSSESDIYRFPPENHNKQASMNPFMNMAGPILSSEQLALARLRAQEQVMEALRNKPKLDEVDRIILKDTLPPALYESFMLAKATEQPFQSDFSRVGKSIEYIQGKSLEKEKSTAEVSQDYLVLRKQKMTLLNKETPVTVMLVGEKQIGKTSLAEFLQTYKHNHVKYYDKHETSFPGIVERYAYLAREDINVKLTVVDTPSFVMDDKTSLDKVFTELEDYLKEKVVRVIEVG